MFRLNAILACTLGFAILLSAPASKAQSVASPAAPDKNSPEKVIIDTDIGDDIDDAFAVALALRSTELQISASPLPLAIRKCEPSSSTACSKKRRARIFPLPQARLHSLRPRLRS